MQITMYVCPTPGCGNYFGSSSTTPTQMAQVMGKTDANFTPNPPETWFHRADCPDCRVRGKKVKRIASTIVLPASAYEPYTDADAA